MRTVCGSKANNKLNKHLKRVSTFLLILDRKRLTYEISKERRLAIASVVGLDNLSSNKSLLSHHLLYIQINVLIGRTEGLYFLINKFLNLYANDTDLFCFRWMSMILSIIEQIISLLQP